MPGAGGVEDLADIQENAAVHDHGKPAGIVAEGPVIAAMEPIQTISVWSATGSNGTGSLKGPPAP